MQRSLLLFATAIGLISHGLLHVEHGVLAQSVSVATTSLEVTNCGNGLVETEEECDVPGETGAYSTTIAGRQCTAQCQFGPYCGDGILQTLFGEECDDGNNEDGDFCGADCTLEPAGSGGGGSSGGGSRSSGGSDEDLGDTSISAEGTAYPGQTVHILLDGDEVGTVRADSDGEFDFAVAYDPGAATMGFWANDRNGTRSITYNTTFDVTQGAVTTVRGIMLPPTIAADDVEIDPGDTVVFSGQTAPNRTVELFIDNQPVTDTTSGSDGDWSITYTASGLSAAEHLAKVRYIEGSGGLETESSFSNSVTLFVGVEGRASTPSDLNRDGEVNLIDFSILIFWWGTAGGDSNPPADINGNGTVAIEDFSILLFNWTG